MQSEKQSHNALIRFCTAKNELTQLDDSISVQRRQNARAAGMYRDLLRDQMVNANVACVPVMCDGKQKYVLLRKSAKIESITKDAVMQVLRNLTYDTYRASQMSTNDNSLTLEDWVVSCLRETMTKSDDCDRPHSVSVVAKRPDDVEIKAVHPSVVSRIQEVATSMHALSESSKQLRKRDEIKRKELQAESKETEEVVAEHLVRHDPENGTQRVRLIHNGNKESTYYLKRKSATRTSRPTMRTALPAIAKLLRAIREESGIDASPSWDGCRWLTSSMTLSRVERRLDECLKSLHAEKTSTRIVLTRIQ